MKMDEINYKNPRIDRGSLLYPNTVQTSWRPQLPLPKEVDIEHDNRRKMDKPTKKESNSKKWSFGRFFRRKKEVESDTSSDDDRKAGFVPQKPRKKDKRRRSSKTSPAGGFDHIVIDSKENEIFLPLEEMQTPDPTQSNGSLERRSRRRTSHLTPNPQQSSSDDEIKSHTSSMVSKYRSDDSVGSGSVALAGAAGAAAGSRRSRAARTERYYKRINRDDELVPVPATRWKTQPVQGYYANGLPVTPQVEMRQSSNPPYNPIHPQNWGYSVRAKPTQYSPIHVDKRSYSFENNINQQQQHPVEFNRNQPPPPPPRDPQRRLHIAGRNDPHRPMSYAFDRYSNNAPTMHGRCVSDDKLWGPNGSIYSSIVPPAQRSSSAQPVPQPRRYISRADNEKVKETSKAPMPGDYKYVADAIPRSRKPIHVVNQEKRPLSLASSSISQLQSPPLVRTTKSGLPSPSPMQIASDFWKKLDENGNEKGKISQNRLSYTLSEPRTLSRGGGVAAQIRNALRSPLFDSEFKKTSPPRQDTSNSNEDENVVRGSLSIKPGRDQENNFVEITNKCEAKSKSMPNYYKRQPQLQAQPLSPLGNKALTPPPNKYEDYIMSRNMRLNALKDMELQKPRDPPVPPMRKLNKITPDASKAVTAQNRKSNLDEAINELETIYKSLRLSDENLLDRAEERDVPTPTCQSKYAGSFDRDPCDEYFEEDNKDDGEPDIVLDDLVYRNIKRANELPKTIDNQPPFGIPLGPVPPSPNTDYLHVIPQKDTQKIRAPHNVPDVVTDDLAVRALRKENGTFDKYDRLSFVYPSGPPASIKKKRAVRSMSANIYSMIHRDAAKPSGGNLYDYTGFQYGGLEKSGSLSDVAKDKDSEIDDIPATLQLLRNLRNQENQGTRKSPRTIFRHPSQGGAVFNLPSTLKTSPRSTPFISQKVPVPLPRRSLSPEAEMQQSGMEDVLNQIAKEAKESSEKLSRELIQLRKEVDLLSKTSESPDEDDLLKSKNSRKMEREIEEASSAAKQCGDLLLDAIPPANEAEMVIPLKPRKLIQEEKLLKDINEVSQAAQICEKILEDAVAVGRGVQSITSPTSTTSTTGELVESGSIDSTQSKGDSLPSDEQSYAVASLIEKINPSAMKMSEIANRCMRQLSELGESKDESTSDDCKKQHESDYENLINLDFDIPVCKKIGDETIDNLFKSNNSIILGRNSQTNDEEEIDKIIKKCEESLAATIEPLRTKPLSSSSSAVIVTEVQSINKSLSQPLICLSPLVSMPNDKSYTKTSDDNRTSDEAPNNRDDIMFIDEKEPFSSSDCLRSSSPTQSRHQSSSITSINAFSSSDYVKSPSSDFNPPSTDPIKTFSTTSYEGRSSSVATPNLASSPFSTTPSPPVDKTPIGDEVGCSESQYNSSEELAMIFGINRSCSPVTTGSTITTATGNMFAAGINACDCNNRNNNRLRLMIVNQNHKMTDTIDMIDNTKTYTTSSNCIETNDATNHNAITSTTATPYANSDEDVCCRCYHNLPPSQQSIISKHSRNVVTIATFNIPRDYYYGRHVVIPTSACLDTILETHDDDDNDNDNDTDNGNDDAFDNDIDCNDRDTDICMDNDNDNETENDDKTYSIDNSSDNCSPILDDVSKTIVSFDSLSSQDESIPDSGNVSLYDFPVQQQKINTRLELSLLYNTQQSFDNNRYPFINQINIPTNDFNDHDHDHDDDDDANNRDDEKSRLIWSTTANKIDDTIDCVNNNCDNNNHVMLLDQIVYDNNFEDRIDTVDSISDKILEDNDDDSNRFSSLETSTGTVKPLLSKLTDIPDTSSSLTQRKSQEESSQSDQQSSLISSSSSSSTLPSSSQSLALSQKVFTQLDDSRHTLIQHFLIALACSVGNNDIFTLLAIIVAVITIVALIIL